MFSYRRPLLIIGGIFLVTFLGGLGLSKLALETYRIPSNSMYPAIEPGDRILAARFSYGIPIPLTGKTLFTAPIARGDIVIFPRPDHPKEDYIKRVIALGGESVEMRGEQVWIDGNPLVESYLYLDPWALKARANRSGGPRRHEGDKGRGASRNAPIRVPARHLFVMGDNRLNSVDSREFGFVPEWTVRGKAWRVYYSRETGQSLFGSFRFKRIGKLLR